MTAADREFHGAVMEISGLTLLRRVWSSFDGPLRLRIYQLVDAAAESGHRVHREPPVLACAAARGASRRATPTRPRGCVKGHILEVKELVREAHGDQLEG